MDFTVTIVSRNLVTTSNFVEFRDSRNFTFFEAPGVRCCMTKEQNIDNYGYIGTWILRKYRKYQKILVDILTKISIMQKLTKIL